MLDVVRTGVETYVPIVALVDAKNHDDTVIPITCALAWEVCTVAGTTIGAFLVGAKTREWVDEKVEEVTTKMMGTAYTGIINTIGF